MKNKALFLLSIILFYSCANNTYINGQWSGFMFMDNKIVDIKIDLNSKQSFLSSKDLMLFGEPISNFKIKDKVVSFKVKNDLDFEFIGKLNSNKMEGTVIIKDVPDNISIAFQLEKNSDKQDRSYSIEKTTIRTKELKLSAHIYRPNTQGLHPAIVLVHGSSTNLKDQYTFYADFFANLGYEVLIFDKRGNGKSEGNYSKASYEDLVNDVISCLEVLKSRQSVDNRKIGIWGYSQGATILPLVVSKTKIPTFMIAISPEITSISEAAAFSDSLRITNQGYSKTDGHFVAECHREIKKMIEKGCGNKIVENYINQNSKTHNFLNQTGLAGNIVIGQDDFDGYYWSGRKENFYQYWNKVNVPALVVFGEDDEYVNAIKNDSLITILNNKYLESKKFPKANHSLKIAFKATEQPGYNWPKAVNGYLLYVESWLDTKIAKNYSPAFDGIKRL